LVYFEVIWYISPVLVSCSEKNLATLVGAENVSFRQNDIFWQKDTQQQQQQQQQHECASLPAYITWIPIQCYAGTDAMQDQLLCRN
jgi:hypothetical protein